MEVQTCTLVIFSGGYDLLVRDDLRDEFDTMVAEPNLVLDFSGVRFFDSACVAELLRLHELRAARGERPETVVVGNEAIRRIFEALRLDRLVNAVDTIDDAIGKWGIPARVRYAFAGAQETALAESV